MLSKDDAITKISFPVGDTSFIISASLYSKILGELNKEWVLSRFFTISFVLV